MPQRELWIPKKKHNHEKPLAYAATKHKSNSELFTKIMKILEELKNKDKIKEILDTTKIIKNQRQPQNLKRISPLLHSEKTQHKELLNAIINYSKFVISL